jgi:DNA adenine methylase
MEIDVTAAKSSRSGQGRTPHGPSFLRWAGSKRKCLPILSASYSASCKSYIEPFAGSAVLFFHLRPATALLADANPHLINALCHIRSDPHEIHSCLSAIPRDKSTYYQVRRRFNESSSPSFSTAVDFIFLNRNCFNGLWRTNQKGHFNVPFGGTEMGAHPPIELLEECSEALKHATLKRQDFRITLMEAQEGDFLFCDPPYFDAAERTFIEYGEKSFGRADLDDLLDGLAEADDRGVRIVLTYAASVTLKVPSRWRTSTFNVTRNVGGFAGSRRTKGESLYTNINNGSDH